MIEGNWFEQGSAAYSNAALLVNGDQFQLKTKSGIFKQGTLSEIEVSDRLGNVQRKLTFDDGSVFATSDNDAIDKLFISTKKINSFIHKIESNLSFVFIALLITLVFSFSFIKWGIPAISYSIAEALPQKTNDIIGAHTFDFLDKYVFEESSLDEERQNQIREHFKETLENSLESSEEINFKLYFRDMSGIPNALALPSGEIILTDKFVELSESQDEIDSVLLHEIGHIEQRHSLKMVIQSTIVTTVIMMVTGDANAVADMGIGLGSILLSANYSRHYESEADQFAFDKMLELEIDPIAFAIIMQRITDYSEEEFGSKKKEKKAPESEITDYFSTHPGTEERTQNARRYSKCFKQGLKICP